MVIRRELTTNAKVKILPGQVYWLKYYRNGKPYYECSKSTKETDAKKLLKKREGEISKGKLPGVYFVR